MKTNLTKKIISYAAAVSMLLSSVATVSAETAVNPWETVKEADNTFRFGIMTDVHVGAGNSNNVQKYMDMTLDAFEAMGVDGLALVGDIAGSGGGAQTETIEPNLHESIVASLDSYNYEIKSDDASKRVNDDTEKPMLYAMGNHEMPSNAQNMKGIQASKSLFVDQYEIDDLKAARKVGNYYTGDYVTEMGGYTFIVTSPRDGLENGTMTSYTDLDGNTVDIEAWAMQQIEAAAEKYKAAGTENKPIFYMQHIPVNSHNGQNRKAHSDEFMEFLKDYPNLIAVSGHVHPLLQDPRVISQDAGYTSLITGVIATGGANAWGGTADATIGSGGDTGIKQAMAMDVTYDEANDTSAIKVYRLDVQNQEFIGTPFEFTIDGTAQSDYSTAARFADAGRSVAKWADGAAARAEAVENTHNIKVTYSTAADVEAGANAAFLQDNYIWGYKAFAKEAGTDTVKATSIRYGEFYKDTLTAERSFVLSDMGRNKSYDVAIYPVTVFYQNASEAELKAAGVTPTEATVTTEDVKSAAERALQMTRTAVVSNGKKASYVEGGVEAVTDILTDGNGGTYFSKNVGNFIIDLERSYKLKNINISVLNGNGGGRGELTVYGSNDKSSWDKIYYRNGSAGDDFADYTTGVNTLSITANSKNYRYVKFAYGKTDTAYILCVDVAITAEIPVTVVSQNKAASANECTYEDFPAGNAVDGTNSFYASQYCTDHRHFLQVDLGAKYPIGMIELQSRPDVDEGTARSYWYAYGSDSADAEALADLSAAVPEAYTQLTKKSNAYLPFSFDAAWGNYVDSYREITDYTTPYQYITIAKAAAGPLQIGELRAFVINPEIADFEYTDGIATVTFSEAMDLTDMAENILVYGADGTLKTVDMTASADSASVSFAAEIGGKVVISENLTNTYGIGMQEDAEYDVIDLSIDYSSNTAATFENMNVAFGKKVISDNTETNSYFSPDVLTDGANYGYTSATGKYYTIDLGRGYDINKIVITMPPAETNVNDQANIHYTLSGSLDGENWTEIHKATGIADETIWKNRVGTFNLTEDVNYRYIKYYNPIYNVIAEIEAYADVEALKVKATSVTSSAVGGNTNYTPYLINGSKSDLTYVYNANSYDWMTVELDKAYPIGMFELYPRGWDGTGNKNTMEGYEKYHDVRVYGSNTAYGEEIEEGVTNLGTKDLTQYGYDKLAYTGSKDAFNSCKASIDAGTLPPEWTFTNGFKTTLANGNRYKYVTFKVENTTYGMEFSEFIPYVLSPTVNIVKTDENGAELHFGDKMAADLLSADTVTLTKDGKAVSYAGSISDNRQVYTMEAALGDGDYTLTVSKDVKNALGVPLQTDYTYSFTIGEKIEYGIKTAAGAAATALAANTEYVVTQPVSGSGERTAIAAVYDENGKLVLAKTADITSEYALEYAQISFTTPETLAENATVKYFLWEKATYAPVIDFIDVLK